MQGQLQHQHVLHPSQDMVFLCSSPPFPPPLTNINLDLSLLSSPSSTLAVSAPQILTFSLCLDLLLTSSLFFFFSQLPIMHLLMPMPVPMTTPLSSLPLPSPCECWAFSLSPLAHVIHCSNPLLPQEKPLLSSDVSSNSPCVSPLAHACQWHSFASTFW